MMKKAFMMKYIDQNHMMISSSMNIGRSFILLALILTRLIKKSKKMKKNENLSLQKNLKLRISIYHQLGSLH